MNHDEHEHDARDPIAAAFADHQRAPRDVVPPRHIEHSVDDLHRLADGGAQVTVTHYEMDENGITRHSEQITVTAPITGKGSQTR